MRSTIRTRAEGGWTLIELLVVISLIMILSSIALASYRNSLTHAKEAALKSDLMLMRDAALISQDEFDSVVRGFRYWLWRHLGLITLACLA